MTSSKRRGDFRRRATRAVKRHAARRGLRPMARVLGFDVVERDYYSPIPVVEQLGPELWTRRHPLPGIGFDVEAQLDFLERELAPFLTEFRPPLAPPSQSGEYGLANDFYGPVDAELLYAMVRRFKPRRMIELGSGDSSLVAGEAHRRNEADGQGESDYLIFDPYPRPELEAAIRRSATLRAVPATEVPLSEFEALGEDDILFVDTTHTVKIGGEVNYLVLEVLPSLAPGVVVHFHDIFLPWEYPRDWVVSRRLERYWAEQYLLQAFLAFNSRFEVLAGSHALARELPERLAGLIPSAAASLSTDTVPGALWLRTRPG